MKNRIDEHPPWLLRLILRFSVRQVNDPSYLGDCVELYRIQQSENGKFRADLWLFKQLIISLPAILFHRVTWASVMFYNTMKISYRNLKTNKVYSVINLAGLSTGLACSILIALFIFDELSFDRHHQVAHRIYRVGTVRGSDQRRGSYTSPPMAAAMKQDFPEIESITRLCLWDWDRLVVYGEKKFVEKRIIGADSTVFQVLTLPLLAGDPDKALTRPNTVVISRSTAEKYFGDENPVGKSLAFDGPQNQLEVTGVMEDCPRTSHLQYDLIFSMESLDMTGAESWMNHTFVTYLKLRESVPKEQLESKF